jgi:phospholipase/carboxylesterase
MPISLDTIVHETNPNATTSIIWLHGLGADGHDFEPIIPELGLDENQVRFIFPNAPVRPITINNGMAMRGWYDIRYPDLSQDVDLQGIQQSSTQITDLVENEFAKGREVILAGFSQGGVVSLYAGIRLSKPLKGILALSCYLASPETISNEVHPINRNTPILMMHGDYDPIIPKALGKASYDVLRGLGYRVEWKSYPMQHGVHPQQISDIAVWLKQLLGNPARGGD